MTLFRSRIHPKSVLGPDRTSVGPLNHDREHRLSGRIDPLHIESRSAVQAIRYYTTLFRSGQTGGKRLLRSSEGSPGYVVRRQPRECIARIAARREEVRDSAHPGDHRDVRPRLIHGNFRRFSGHTGKCGINRASRVRRTTSPPLAAVPATNTRPVESTARLAETAGDTDRMAPRSVCHNTADPSAVSFSTKTS